MNVYFEGRTKLGQKHAMATGKFSRFHFEKGFVR